MSKDLEWYGLDLEKDLQSMAAAMLLRAAMTFQKLHKKDLSKSNPPPKHSKPSKKGEYPRGRTWNLRDSVAYTPTTLADVKLMQVVRVGYRTNAGYGVTLGESMGRKWLLNSLAEHEAEIAAAMGGAGTSRMV